MHKDIILQVQGLKKYFGSVRAVDGVSLSVSRGEVYGFLGPMSILTIWMAITTTSTRRSCPAQVCMLMKMPSLPSTHFQLRMDIAIIFVNV